MKLRKFGPRLTVSLTQSNHDRLNHMAESQGASVSWIIRRAIDEYLSKVPDSDELKLSFQAQQKSGNKK